MLNSEKKLAASIDRLYIVIRCDAADISDFFIIFHTESRKVDKQLPTLTCCSHPNELQQILVVCAYLAGESKLSIMIQVRTLTLSDW